MIAVRGGWELKHSFFATWLRNLLRLISFFGIVGSFCDSNSWMRVFAMSNRPQIPLVSGGSFAFFCPFDCDPGGRVIVCVAMAEKLSDCGDMEREEKSSQGVGFVCGSIMQIHRREHGRTVNLYFQLTTDAFCIISTNQNHPLTRFLFSLHIPTIR